MYVKKDKTYLKHVAEHAEDAVESLVLLGFRGLPSDTGHHFSNEDQIDDQRRGKERILADIEHADCLVAAKEDLGIVLVESTLIVTNSRHVLDHDGVVRVLILLVEDSVGGNHVIDDVGLGDLLGAELLLGAQVHAIVVAKMVVAGNRGELDTSIDQEVNKSRLHLGLARLEVITADEGTVFLGKLYGTGDEGVLRRAVDEGSVLQNRRNSEDGGRRHFLVAIFDGLDKVVGSVIDARDDLSIALSVGSPHNNDLVQAIGSLEVTLQM